MTYFLLICSFSLKTQKELRAFACMGPVSLLQQDISIRCLLFCFLFTARNRKTCFPAFSIPNGLVLRKNIPSESTLKATQRARETKPSPFSPHKVAKDWASLLAWYPVLLAEKTGRIFKLQAHWPKICSAGARICRYASQLHLSQKDKPVNQTRAESGKGLWEGA